MTAEGDRGPVAAGSGSLPVLRLRVLGAFEVEGLRDAEVGTRKARTLLKALALARGGPVAADRLAEIVWGDDPPARVGEQVSVLVSRLRGVLGPDRVERHDAGYALRADWLDLAEAEARVEEASSRIAAGAYAAGRSAARAALDLVRGPLLPDEDGDWVVVERAAVERLVARARVTAAEAALLAGDPATAASDAEAALDYDPYDEHALRLAMTAFLRIGRRGSALACYARMRRRLRDDLGVGTGPETERIYELALAEHPPGPPSPATRIEGGPLPPLAGRQGDLAALHAALARVRDGGAAVVVVEGEAGIGKSALVSRFAAEAAAAGAVVLTGRCDDLGRDLPLQPVVDAIDRHLMSVGGEAAAELLGADAPVLGPVLGRSPAHLGPGPTATALRDSDTGRALLFGALLSLTRRLAADATTVLVIEDFHHAGAGTVEWCRIAARRGDRLLLVVTRRPGGGHSLAGEEAETVSLGPLDRAAVAELVGSERADDLLARSGGHPLFLVELASSPDGSLPASVRAAVEERVEALGPAAPTIRAAAVLGPHLDLDLLAAATGQPALQILAHLEEGLSARLLAEEGATLGFRHQLVREALATGVTAGRRAYLHRQAAQALAARPSADPLDVAFYARRGGEGELAAGALIRAAEVAERRFDLEAAEELLDEAVHLRDSAETRQARARIRMARWAVGAAAEDADQAVAHGGGAAALELAGWAAYYQRDYPRAERRADAALARASDPGLRSSSLTLAGRLRHSRGDLAGAHTRLAEAAAIATPDVRGVAQIWLASLESYRGRTEEAIELFGRALAEPEPFGHPFALLHGWFGIVRCLGLRGRLAEALEALAQLDSLIVRSGRQGDRFHAVALNTRSWLARNVGDIEEAKEANREARAASLEPAQYEPHHVAALDLVECHLLDGDEAGARRWLEQAGAVDTWEGTMAWHQRHRLGVLRAEVALAGGDPAGALAAAAAVEADAGARGEPRYRALAELVAARASAAMGRPYERDRVDAALEVLDRVAGLEAWRATADVAAGTGDDGWWRVARGRLDTLVATAGDQGPKLRDWAERYLSRLGPSPSG